jgi:uncharacterized protein (TIGR04255 family)
MSELLASLPIPPGIQQSVVHKFETADRKRFISLNENFLALTETSYVQWESFREELQLAERIFQTEYQASFYERLGLRYKNTIDREALGLAPRAWAELLNPSFLGLLTVTEADVAEIKTQSLVRLPNSSSGFVRIVHGLARADGSQKQLYAIDSDFFAAERSETGDAFRLLDEFHRLASRFFRWAITPELRAAMGPRPID